MIVIMIINPNGKIHNVALILLISVNTGKGTSCIPECIYVMPKYSKAKSNHRKQLEYIIE